MRGFLFIALLFAASPSPAQDGRPELSIPEPTRKRSTPQPGGTFTIVQVDYNDARKERDYLTLSAQELVTFTTMATKLEAKLDWRRHTLDDPRIIGALMLYMTGFDAVVRVDKNEKQNLARYLEQGGLLFAEDILPLEAELRQSSGIAGTPFDRQFKALIKDPDVLGNAGRHWRKIPKNDPLYSTYFEFRDGPPLSGAHRGNVFALEALELRGRTAIIFSDLNISWFWGNLEADGRDRSLQFGSNLVIYALTKKFAGRPLPFRR